MLSFFFFFVVSLKIKKKKPNFDVVEWTPALDSSMFNPTHWIKLADNIEKEYYNYDGFVILHGSCF